MGDRKAGEDSKARLAEALRENLRRRKAAARRQCDLPSGARDPDGQGRP